MNSISKKKLINHKTNKTIFTYVFRKKYLFIILVLLIAVFVVFNPAVISDTNDPWFNTEWEYRKEISINHQMIDEDLTGFPVLIDINGNDIANHAQSNGDDFVFTNRTGMVSPHEIEKYNSSTGHLVAWVNVSFLSSTEDTVLYVYYGNLSCGNQENVEDTWVDDFMAVHHLNEDWSTDVGHFEDSTGNGHDGTLVDGNANSDSDVGVAGSGFRFNGDADFINIGAVSHNQPITYSCWFKADSIDANKCAFGRFWTGYYLGTWNWDSGYLRHRIHINSSGYYRHTSGVSNVWYYMTVSYDGSTVRYYVDGSEVGSVVVSGDLSATGHDWHIGDYGNGGLFFDGVVDEVRIANRCFSSGWISSYFNNVDDSSSFFSVGVEETHGVSPVISNEVPEDGSVNIGLNPLLKADVYDEYGDELYCEIWTNASNDWQLLNSTIFYDNFGTIKAYPENMNEYNNQYWWSVNCTDGTSFKTLRAVS